MPSLKQNKSKEVDFFDRHALQDDYNVFTDEANRRIVDAFLKYTSLQKGALVSDIGCGSGVFTNLLSEKGLMVCGVDISPKLILLAEKKYPNLHFLVGDAEQLAFESNSLDGVLLSGLIHHFPDSSLLAQEVHRVLKPNGRVFAFDPNRMNPFMYLYRDHSSPFYSNVGVTNNERPILSTQINSIFRKAGFSVNTAYLSGLSYRYVASPTASKLLPAYNLVDKWIFKLPFLNSFSPFVLTYGTKV